MSLPRLSATFPIVDKDGRPTIQFQTFWQKFVEQQETTDAAQQSTLNLLNLVNSTPAGCTITAADVGSDATITVSAHTRVYGDGTSVSVTGGTIAGQAFSTLFYCYYDQASREGGAVTYSAATSYADACPSQANPNRHFVGTVTSPANGAAPSSGEPSTPPGWGGSNPIP